MSTDTDVTKWEYRVVSYDVGMLHRYDKLMREDLLNNMGQAGWELCAVIPVMTMATKEQQEIYDIHDAPGSVTFQYIFKRPVQAGA
jgi:hypothetical protein